MAYLFRRCVGSAMLQLTFGVPLSSFRFDLFPSLLREHSSAIRFVRFGTEGFLLTARVPPEERDTLLRLLRQHYRAAPIQNLEVSLEGRSMIRIEGGWFSPRYPQGGRVWNIFRQFRALEQGGKISVYHPPALRGDSIQVSVVGESEALSRFRRDLSRLDIPHRIHAIRSLEKEADHPLDTLTPVQRKTLLAAHRLGYYAVPRRAGTVRIAKELGVNPGTVGRHLRRAEKHVIDWAISGP